MYTCVSHNTYCHQILLNIRKNNHATLPNFQNAFIHELHLDLFSNGYTVHGFKQYTYDYISMVS